MHPEHYGKTLPPLAKPLQSLLFTLLLLLRAASLHAATATYLTTDTTTHGDWKGVYGGDGFNVINDVENYASYATVSTTGAGNYTWSASTTDVRALRQAASTTDRIAAQWISNTSFTINLNLTDTATHQVALYFLDWDSTSRTASVDVKDAASGTVLDTRAISSFNGGKYLVWNLSGNVQIVVTRTNGSNATVSGIFFGGATPSANATFLTTDITTKGSWKGVYGADGYNIVNDTTSPPAYAAVSTTGAGTWTWSASTSDVRALQKAASSTDRIAAQWISNTAFTINLNLSDTATHKIALYFLDWDSTSRTASVQVKNAATGAVLDTRTVSAFNPGKYLVWNVTGNVQFVVTRTGGSNATVSGIFFGGAGSVTSADYVSSDSTTKGNWKGIYGADGGYVVNDTANYPAYATVSVTGAGSYTWNASTTDPRAPLKLASTTDRLASQWISNTSFTINLNLTDGNAHRVALYFLDWDSTSRAVSVQVLNAATGAVLDTRAVSGFNGGQYLVWNLKGNLQLVVTRTNGSNATVSGIFFGGAGAGTPPAFFKRPLTGIGLNCADGADFPHVNYMMPDNALLDWAVSLGVNVLRVSFRWEALQPTLNGAFDAARLADMKDLMTHCHARGINVLWNMHNFGFYNNQLVGSAAVPDSAFADFWRRFATEFKDDDYVAMYSLMNEPSLSCPNWKASAQAAVNAIRTVDARTPIAVAGRGAWVWDWNADVHRNADMKDVTSAYVVFEGHQYPDSDSSGRFQTSYETWMQTVSTWGLSDINDFHLSICQNYFDWLAANNLRGFLGETGMPSGMMWRTDLTPNAWAAHWDYRDGWVEAIRRTCVYGVNHGIPVFIWSGGVHIEQNKLAVTYKAPWANGQPTDPIQQMIKATLAGKPLIQ